MADEIASSAGSEMPATDARIEFLPIERRALALVTGVSMLRMLGLFALLPVLSLYAAGLDGATPLMLGLAVGAYGLTQATLQIPLGALSDRIGRKPVLIGGLIVFAAGSAIAGLSDSATGVVVGRLLQGAGAISSALTALVADITRREVRTRSMAVLGVGIGASFVLAMAFGPWFSAHYGVPALFGFCIVVAVLAAGLVLSVPPGTPPQPRRLDLRPALRPALLRLDASAFVLHAILTASFVALPFLLGRRLELASTMHWQVYVGAIVVSLAGTVPLILADERRGQPWTIAIAVTLLLAGELVLGLAAFSVATALAALAMFFAGFNFLEASLPARLSVLADEDARGASLGVYSSAQFLGLFAGGLVGGRFIAGGNPSNVFLVCALVAAIWLALQGLVARAAAPAD
jgi:MFS family permease